MNASDFAPERGLAAETAERKAERKGQRIQENTEESGEGCEKKNKSIKLKFL
ncbi:MAG TPA: hypothetical protein VF590_05115 [Isosphaeraceae bacterium]|jgi:hypothetical protein